MTIQFDLFDQKQNTILDAKTYDEFSTLLRNSNCQGCGLARSRTTIVIDRGNPRSGILAIGEGPGEEEDQKGLAFVGRAGRLLDRCLQTVGLDGNTDLLIANVVKCHPAGNRTPTQEEAATCKPYLNKQIELINPHTIVLLGATAYRHMTAARGTIRMEELAGTFLHLPDYPKIDCLILFHPAFILRNARRERDMVKHLKVLADHLKKRV